MQSRSFDYLLYSVCYFKHHTYAKADKLYKYSCPITFTSSIFDYFAAVV